MEHAKQSNDGRYLEGVLFKWTNVMKGWQPRYFILDTQTATLSYYHSQVEIDVGCKGSYRVTAACQIHVDPAEATAIELRFPPLQHQPLYLKASTAQERQKWIAKLIEIKSRDANTLDITKSPPAQLLLSSSAITPPNGGSFPSHFAEQRLSDNPPVRTVTLTHAEIEDLRSKQKEARFYRQQLKLLLENLNRMRDSSGENNKEVRLSEIQRVWHEIEPVSDVLLSTITECLDVLDGKLGNDEKLLSTAASTVVTSAVSPATLSSSFNGGIISARDLNSLPDGVQLTPLPKVCVTRCAEQTAVIKTPLVIPSETVSAVPVTGNTLLPAAVAHRSSDGSISEEEFVDARDHVNRTSSNCSSTGLRSFSTVSGGSDLEDATARPAAAVVDRSRTLPASVPSGHQTTHPNIDSAQNFATSNNGGSSSSAISIVSTTSSTAVTNMAHQSDAGAASASSSSTAAAHISPPTHAKKLHAPERSFQTIFSQNDTTFFDALAPAAADAVDGGGVYTDAFLKSITPILNMLDILGKRAFYPVKKDLQGNINRLRKHYEDNPKASTTLQNIVEADNGPFNAAAHHHHDKISRPQGSAEAMLWLKRGLQFLERFLYEILLKTDQKKTASDEDLSKCAQAAYDVTLRQHHNALARGVFHIALKAMPAKSDFLHAVVIAEQGKHRPAVDGAESQRIILDDVKQFRLGLSRALARLQRYYEARGFEEKSMYVLDE